MLTASEIASSPTALIETHFGVLQDYRAVNQIEHHHDRIPHHQRSPKPPQNHQHRSITKSPIEIINFLLF